MPPRKTCACAVVAFCFTTTFKPYYSSIFGTTLVALSSLQPHAWSLWSFTCFRICCSHLCTLPFVLLYVSSHICTFICVLLLSFHVMPCSICCSLHYLGSLAGVIKRMIFRSCVEGANGTWWWHWRAKTSGYVPPATWQITSSSAKCKAQRWAPLCSACAATAGVFLSASRFFVAATS